MKIITFISIICLLMSCQQKKTLEIKGSLPGAQDGTIVKLMNADNNPAVLIDSVTVKNETFTLTSQTPTAHPIYAELVVDMTPEISNKRKKTLKAYRFFADNTRMEFKCHIDSMPSYYWEPVNKKNNVSLTGSPTQDLLKQYTASVKELSDRKSALSQQYHKVYHVPALNGIFNTAEGLDIVRKRNAVIKELNEATLRFIKNNNNSVVAVHLATQLLRSTKASLTTDEIDDIINCFDPSLKDTPLMKGLEKVATEVRSCARGIKYHDIPLVNLKGEQVRLSSHIKPGMYNMLEFWASWCSPCRAEIPHLRHLHNSGGKEHLHMVGISIDTKNTDWQKAITEEHMEWTQLCDPNGLKGPVSDVYQVHGVPYCLILDPDGRIVAGGLRGAVLDLALIDLLGDKITP